MPDDAKWIGVTGTNGKTSIASFIAQLSRASGYPAAAAGQRIELDGFVQDRRIIRRFGGSLPRFFQHLNLHHGCRVIACEVYSAAIKRGAHRGIAYDVVVFSNLASDHQDVHGSDEKYREDKLRFFEGLSAGTPVFIPDSAERMTRIYDAARDAKLSPQIVETRRSPQPFPDEFMNANLALALAACCSAGMEMEALEPACQRLSCPPGRMVRRSLPAGGQVIVDFAHNPHGLETVLGSLRGQVSRNLSLILSSKGGWSRDKRRQMGAVAGRYADQVCITDDDPRQEDAALIRAQLRTRPDFEVVPDRATAIRRMIARLGRGDTLLIAGRGEDDYFVNAFGRKLHNDLLVVDRLINRMKITNI